jgi:hypothetical protein
VNLLKRMLKGYPILSFLKNQKSLLETSDYKILAGQAYYLVTFPLMEFIRYIGLNSKSHSQRTKVLNILTTLQTLELIIQSFDDLSFQSSLIVPAFNIKKKKNKWIISIALAKKNSIYIIIRFNFQLILLLTSTITSFRLNYKSFKLLVFRV